MRRRPTPHDSTAAPTPAAPDLNYDWGRFGRHRLRTPAAVVVDNPLAPARSGWMATLWPDTNVPGGWGRMIWQPDSAYARGWLIPDRLALGDVLEFGAHSPADDCRWYGILDSYEVAAWLTVQGPYPDPSVALVEADRLLAGERYLPPLDPEPRRASTRPCARHPRRRPRHP